MASRHELGHEELGFTTLGDDVSTAVCPQPPWSVRLRARMLAQRYDREIEAGVVADPGSPLAVHGARLASTGERDDLIRALRLVAHGDGPGRSRAPVRSDEVRRNIDLIGRLCERLADPFPVRVRGMARLRILLSDGRGPLYRARRGTLAAALRGVLATL